MQTIDLRAIAFEGPIQIHDQTEIEGFIKGWDTILRSANNQNNWYHNDHKREVHL